VGKNRQGYGLVQEIGRADTVGTLDSLLVLASGDDEDRRFPYGFLASDRFAHSKSVDFGHLNVEENNIGAIVGERFQRDLAVCCSFNAKAGFLQDTLQKLKLCKIREYCPWPRITEIAVTVMANSED
jgi:hypothetical protein